MPHSAQTNSADTRETVQRLWREHRRWVAAIVYAHMPRGADLEDLLQDVAMKLVRHFHTLDARETLRPWLRTVAINVARSAGRREKVRAGVRTVGGQELDVVSGSRESSMNPVPDVEDARTRGRRALALADSLPTHYREPLMLSLRGLSQRQIADVLDVPVSTIETRLIRARRMVREELNRDESQTGMAVPEQQREVTS